MTQYQFGKIKIKKRTFPEWLTKYIFIFPLIMSFFLEFLRLPSVVKYTVDVAWLLVLISMLIRKRASMRPKYSPMVIFILGFFLYTLIVYLFNFQSPFYYLWGVRNSFRFYVAFIAFAMLFEEDEVSFSLKILDALFWVNAVISFIQFFLMGYQQDHLGGIFGIEKGCNAYSIIFFSFIVGKSVLSFMDKKEKAWVCFLKCGISLLISAMAELKFFFIVFLLILILATVLTKFSWRKFSLLFISAVLVMLTSSLLTAIFGAGGDLSLDRIIELATATNYATAKDLGRLTAIPTIARRILTEIPAQIFGMGLGNCDTSSFAICNTPFYQSYQSLHYSWFSSAFLFLETGYVGLLAYLSFFVMVFFLARKNLRSGSSDELFCQIGMIMAIVCVILTFYNSSLRTEIGYLAFFALALPFIGRDRQTEKERAQ